MMPVVDSCVSLSQENYALHDYLAQANRFHVLRMVAVQQVPTLLSANVSDTNERLKDAQSMQTQATTRGSGGLPNGIVAYCDLADYGSIKNLVEYTDLQNLRGVHHDFVRLSENNSVAECASDFIAAWSQSITLLTANKLCVDLTVTIESATLLQGFAQAYPDTELVINVVGMNQEQFEIEQWMSLLMSLVPYKKAFIKLSCANMLLNSADFKAVLIAAVDVLGAERVMFASGLNGSQEVDVFNKQWEEFIGAAEQLRAKQRDMIFRSNAVGVYNL